MNHLSGFILRAATPGDFQAVADVVVAGELAARGRSTLGADFVAGEWSLPGFGLETDACVAADDAGAVVGYAQAVFEEPNVVDSWGVVHPAYRGRGLGKALFDQIERRAHELLDGIDAPILRHKTDAGDQAAAAILRSRGLRPVRRFRTMERDLTAPIPTNPNTTNTANAAASARSAPLPPDVAVIGIDPAKDLPTVHAIINQSLAEHWGERPTEFEPWIEEHRADPAYYPTLWLLAAYQGEPAGALTMTARTPPRGSNISACCPGTAATGSPARCSADRSPCARSGD